MTKIMLQIGTLAFFVSAVVFGSRGFVLMDTLTRSFIVFVAVVAGQTLLLIVMSAMKNRTNAQRDLVPAAGPDEAADGGQQAGERTQAAPSAPRT
jgi:hypothetical protein